MKSLSALAGIAGVGCMFWVRPFSSPPVKIIILGNHQGYLSPCGCSEPMTGGILREATLIRSLTAVSPSVVVDTGDFTAGDSRQEVMKAETLAQTLKSVGVLAVNLTPTDEKLGVGELGSLQSLSGNAFTSVTRPPSQELEIDRFKKSNSFLVVGISPANEENSIEIDLVLTEAIRKAKADGLKIMVMLEGTEEEAVKLADVHPEIDLISYRSSSAPSQTLRLENKTALVSPGEHGEYLISLSWTSKAEPDYTVYRLTPKYPDDPVASRFYKTYLKRVDHDPDLWDHHFRQRGKPFAGAATCGKCHQSDYQIWKNNFWNSSEGPINHAQALHTLVAKGHGKDPECLPCHVTGATVFTGFHSIASDPQLAFVSCESCHGAGVEHSINPFKNSMPLRKPQDWVNTCEKCHTPLNSPNFDFNLYWKRIKHGNGDNGWKSKK